MGVGMCGSTHAPSPATHDSPQPCIACPSPATHIPSPAMPCTHPPQPCTHPSHAPPATHAPSYAHPSQPLTSPCGQTDTYENITFLQLYLWAVKMCNFGTLTNFRTQKIKKIIVTNITLTGSAMVNWNTRLLIQGVTTVIVVNVRALGPW